MQATYRRRTRAASESALSDITSKTTTPGNADTSGNASISPRSDIPRARQASTPARPPSLELNAPALDNTSPFSSSSREGTAGGMVAFVGAAAAAAAAAASRGDLSPVDRQRRSRREPSTPPPHRSPFSFSSSDVKRGVCDREGSGGYWAEGKGRGQREGGDADGKSSMLPRDSMGVSTSPVTDVRSEEWLDLGEDNSDIDDLAAQPCSGVALVGNAPDDGFPSLPMADKPEVGIWPSSLTSRWRRRRLDSLLNPALPVSPGIVLPPERTQKASCVADPSCAGSEEFDAVAGGARSRCAVRGSGAARRDDVADVAANAGQEESELQLRDEWGSGRRASFSVGVWDYRKAISGAKKSVNTRRLSGSDRLYR